MKTCILESIKIIHFVIRFTCENFHSKRDVYESRYSLKSTCIFLLLVNFPAYCFPYGTSGNPTIYLSSSWHCAWEKGLKPGENEIDAYERVACIRLLGTASPCTGHTAELCLVNEARLIRIRTLINSPAEFSSSSRRLASRPTAYPSFPFSTEGRMVLALRASSSDVFSQQEGTGERRLRGKPLEPISRSSIFIHRLFTLSLSLSLFLSVCLSTLSLGTYGLSCVY